MLLDSTLHPDLTVSRKSCRKQPERINNQKEPVRAIISHVAQILQTEPNQKCSAFPPTHWLTLVLILVTFKKQNKSKKTHNRIQILKGFQCQNFYFNPSPTNLQRTSVTTRLAHEFKVSLANFTTGCFCRSDEWGWL